MPTVDVLARKVLQNETECFCNCNNWQILQTLLHSHDIITVAVVKLLASVYFQGHYDQIIILG